jgi:autotransporter-associated beta strand protein
MATILTLSDSAVADSGTWTNDASGSWSNLNNWSGSIIADGSGNTADFSTIDISADRTVTVDTSRTIGNIMFGDTDTSSAAGWTLTRTGTNDLTLASGGTITVTNLAAGKSVDINVPLAGTTDIAVRGGGGLDFSALNTLYGRMHIGTVDDNNNVTFSAAGLTFSPTPDWTFHFKVGESHSGNTMTVAAGCRAEWLGGGYVGEGVGGDANTLIVTGGGAEVVIHANGGSQFNLGASGANSNHVEVSAGGTLTCQKFVIGRGGGTDNSALITGTNSRVRFGQDNQCCVNVGTDTEGSARNSITIDNGGSLLYYSSAGKSGGSIGDSDGADDNYILVKANSTFEFRRTTPVALPFVLGAYNGRDGDNYKGFPIDSTANGNHLDIAGGGSFITENCSVYLMGVNSAMNLGDGIGISQATIGASESGTTNYIYSPGIILFKADSRLNFNSGRLTSAAAGAMVSGPGVVSNTGPAYVSTTYTNSSIDSVIVGHGSLTKEGTGTLILSATNSYSGDTMVEEGVLRLDVPFLSDEAGVYLDADAKMDLRFNGIDVIGSLYLNGIEYGAGTYGASASRPAYFSGPGKLRVVGRAGQLLIIR